MKINRGFILGFIYACAVSAPSLAHAFVLCNSTGHPVIVFASVYSQIEVSGEKRIQAHALVMFKALESGSFLSIEPIPSIKPDDEIHIRIYDPTKIEQIKEIRAARAKAQEEKNIDLDLRLKESLNQYALIKMRTPRGRLHHHTAISIKKEGARYTLS
jgi:hypothetical protein